MIYDPLLHGSQACRNPVGERLGREIHDWCSQEGLDPALLLADLETAQAAKARASWTARFGRVLGWLKPIRAAMANLVVSIIKPPPTKTDA